MDASAIPQFSVSQLHAAYNGTTVLHGLGFDIPAGQCVGLAGPNGAGKSTLVRILAGLLDPRGGRVLVRGCDIKDWERRALCGSIAYLPQESQTPFALKVWEVVWQGRHCAGAHWWPRTETDMSLLASALGQADVEPLFQREFNKLSGGEKKRVLLARLIAQQAPVWLLDEPMASLDLRHQRGVLKILDEARKAGRTIIVSEHRLDLLAEVCDRILLLGDGRLIADGPPAEVLVPGLLEQAFGVRVQVGHEAGGGWSVRTLG